MSVLRMIVEAAGFFAFALLLFGLVGFGITHTVVARSISTNLLLCPAVGLGVVYIGMQWLSTRFTSAAALGIVLALTGPFSLLVAVRSRRLIAATFARCRRDALIVTTSGVALYMVLLLPSLRAGAFTLTEYGADGLFYYAPSASFLGSHAYGAANATAVQTTALTALRIFQVPLCPGSWGTVEGALSVFSQHPPHAILEPLNAFCIALLLACTYVLAVSVLRLSWRVGLLAAAVMGTNQFVFWTVGFDHAEEMRAAVVSMAALVLGIQALSRNSIGLAIVAGALGQAVSAIYLPVFAVFITGLGGAALLAIAVPLSQRRRPPCLGALAASLLSGLAFGALNLRWLLTVGIRAWSAQVNATIPPDHPYAVPFPLASLVGTEPIAYLYHYVPLLFWSPAWRLVAHVLAYCVILLAFAGVVGVARRAGFPVAGMFAGALAYALYVRFGVSNVYGRTKTGSYLLPLTSVLLAAGIARIGPAAARSMRWLSARATGSPPCVPRRRHRPRGAALATGLGGVIVLGVQVAATVETQHMFDQLPISMPKADLALVPLPRLIPERAHVLIYDPALSVPRSGTANTFLLRVAAYLLANHPNVTVPNDGISAVGPPYFPAGRELTCAALAPYTFVVTPSDTAAARALSVAFSLRWSAPDVGLDLYERNDRRRGRSHRDG